MNQVALLDKLDVTTSASALPLSVLCLLDDIECPKSMAGDVFSLRRQPVFPLDPRNRRPPDSIFLDDVLGFRAIPEVLDDLHFGLIR